MISISFLPCKFSIFLTIIMQTNSRNYFYGYQQEEHRTNFMLRLFAILAIQWSAMMNAIKCFIIHAWMRKFAILNRICVVHCAPGGWEISLSYHRWSLKRPLKKSNDVQRKPRFLTLSFIPYSLYFCKFHSTESAYRQLDGNFKIYNGPDLYQVFDNQCWAALILISEED